jgi:hypothetical protein
MKIARFACIAVAAIAIAGICSASATAQTIYRCGNEYTRVPCSGGTALDVGDPRSAAQRAEARRLVAAEQRLGASMERDRRRAEAELKPAQAASLGPARIASAPAAKKGKAAAARKKSKAASDAEAGRDFIAGVPGSGRKATTRP